jgi:hypothetical protein
MGSRLLSWFDVTNTEWPLNGELGYYSTRGPQGLYGIPVTIITQDVPQQPGTTEKYIQRLPSQPTIPLFIQADTEEDLDAARRALKYAMQASRGIGTLQHTANDGAIRELNCRLAKGFEGDESAGRHVPGGLFLDLQFFAADPFWYDVNFQQLIFAVSAGSALLGTGVAFIPIHLSGSGLSGSASVFNAGDADAWPVWTVTGPMTSCTFLNNTTGDTMTIVATLTSVQSVTIDTSPGQKTIIRENGVKHFEYLSPVTGNLWSMAPGTNSLTITLAGSSGATQVALQYKQRYEEV